MSSTHTASIVIPAHNEASVIGRLLDGILAGTDPDEFLIVVSCNGCTDGTVALARARGVHVVETARASKIAALNAGDRKAGDVFPRLYIDADVVISTDDVRKVVRALSVDAHVAAAPKLHVVTAGRPAIVRGFYHVLVRLPWVTNGLLGSGFYGVSRVGRQSFIEFPEIINDDEFVRGLFSDSERISVKDATFRIEAPMSTRSLIRAKARVVAGTGEMIQRNRDEKIARGESTRIPRGGSLPFLRLMADPRNWIPILAYATVRVGARVYRRTEVMRKGQVGWEQDTTTRALTR